MNRIRYPAIAPYALDVLGSKLVQLGGNPQILDLTFEDNLELSIKTFLNRYTPDVLFLTLRNTSDLYFPSFLDLEHKGSFLPEHKTIVDIIKRHYDVNKIVVGGAGFSANPHKILKRLELLHGVQGPGEEYLQDAIRSVLNRSAFPVIDGRASPIDNVIHRKFVNNKLYYQKGGLGNLRTSNGCFMDCSFCVEPHAKGRGTYFTSMGGPIQTKNTIANIIFELDELLEQGINDIHFVDSEFNLPLHHSKEVLQAIIAQEYSKDVRFWAYCQPAPFDEKYAQLLAKANVGINFGSDHTDQEMLQKLGKWFKFEDIKKTTQLCKDYGVAVAHDVLFGYPGDTPDKMYKAIDELLELDPHVIGVTLGIAVTPGTRIEKFFEKQYLRDSEGFYVAGEPLLDPTFYVDPSFKIPEIFDDIKKRVGTDIYRVMIPQVKSTSPENNQLVNSERVIKQLSEGKKGPTWYHYRDIK